MTSEDGNENTSWVEDYRKMSSKVFRERGGEAWADFIDAIHSPWRYKNNVKAHSCCLGLNDILVGRDIVFEFRHGWILPLNVFRTQIKKSGKGEYTDWFTRACPFCGERFKLEDESELCKYTPYAICNSKESYENRDCSKCGLIEFEDIPKDYLDGATNSDSERRELYVKYRQNADVDCAGRQDGNVGK